MNGDKEVVEKQQPQVESNHAANIGDMESNSTEPKSVAKQSMFKSLGLLDRFLAVWIFLAMAIGIILGAFVDDIGPTLQKGTFVGVSIPIGR